MLPEKDNVLEGAGGQEALVSAADLLADDLSGRVAVLGNLDLTPLLILADEVAVSLAGFFPQLALGEVLIGTEGD